MSNIGLVNEPCYKNSYDLVPSPYYYRPLLSSPLFHSSANYQQPYPGLFHSSANYQQPYPGLFHSSANYQQPYPGLFHSSANYQQPYPGLFPPLQANVTDGDNAFAVNFSGKRSIPTHGWHYHLPFHHQENIPVQQRIHAPVPPFVAYPKTEETVALLKKRIVKQIEFYFSDENLRDDYYLKSLMNGEGWVCISAIAEFRRMRRMCTDINFILNAVKDSALMEVKRHMIRRRCTTC
ncbi:hypothetical protein Pint_07913 [Pistacia integerrima]|uniref:Uncharacterized protein n=1 Tax=Pistacia integerrima TaxID=434235 RepID=A0ACC0XSM2_9ROSI|nr:hypothetical protein Pint_07913 [Pistacia integerrima]